MLFFELFFIADFELFVSLFDDDDDDDDGDHHHGDDDDRNDDNDDDDGDGGFGLRDKAPLWMCLVLWCIDHVVTMFVYACGAAAHACIRLWYRFLLSSQIVVRAKWR